MSRLIQQPVASVKLTNVATVRLVVAGKRFEIACYKNKILDYRAGLETDVTEVLQTTRIFTNVTAGQFAAAIDLQAAFGESATDEEIAIRILQQGKSMQVSEAERNALFDSTLTQITTWLANNCIHSETGKPYTVSQIKQELTNNNNNNSAAPGVEGKQKKKNNNNKKKNKQQAAAHFTIQPHKPIKQQYLQAFKYLKNERCLPIQRAPMEIAWHYDTAAELQSILDTLQDLQIVHADDEQQQQQQKESPLILRIDPSNYRPLHQKAETDSTRLEIVRQRVDGVVTTAAPPTVGADDDVAAVEEEQHTSVEQHDQKGDHKSDHRDREDDYVAPTSQKQKLKNKKKQKKKAQRRLERSAENESSSSNSEHDEEESRTPQPVLSPVAPQPASGVKRCNTCVGVANAFSTAAAYRAHFQSDWHRYNQKLKLQGAAPIGLAEFENCDAESFFLNVLDA